MKKIILKIAILSIAIVTLSSCVENNDYSIPTFTEVNPGLTATNTIQSVKDMLNSSSPIVDFKTVSNEGLMIIEGYVVSSDESGNIYKTISIQDKPENPTAAIQLAVDATDLYTSYEVGRKVFVKLYDPNQDFFKRNNKIGLTNNRGVIEIGQLNGTEVERISVTDYKSLIIRSTEKASIVPLKLNSISDLDDSKLSMLVQLKDMQAATKNQAYANLDNTFSVNRTLKSCADDQTIIMRNSGFADFKAQIMPQGKGTITAVAGKFSSTFQLFVRSTDDIVFDGNRCDPLFEGTFENFDLFTIQNVLGNEEWTIESRFGLPKPSAKISGFRSGSGAQNNEDWLITNVIDLSGVTGANLSFDNVKRFNGPDIEVYYSTNYNGANPNDSANTWTKLSPQLDTNTGSWTSWTNSGDLDISSAAGGNVYIAFKYVSTSSAAATFEIDNVKVVAK